MAPNETAAAIRFAGLTCEARLDCGGALAGATRYGLVWSCAGPALGHDGAANLHLSDVVLDCGEGSRPIHVDPTADGAGDDYAVGVSRTRIAGDGEEVAEWRIDIEAGAGCGLSATATASAAGTAGAGWLADGALPGVTLHPGAAGSGAVALIEAAPVYPIVRFEVPRDAGCAGGDLARGAGVTATYTASDASAPLRLPHRFDR